MCLQGKFKCQLLQIIERGKEKKKHLTKIGIQRFGNKLYSYSLFLFWPKNKNQKNYLLLILFFFIIPNVVKGKLHNNLQDRQNEEKLMYELQVD